MQQISFAVAEFLEWTFGFITVLGWLPVTAFTLIMGFGLVYWLVLQGRYNRKAERDGTLA